MKKIKNIILSLGLILSIVSCEDKSKNPFPIFIEGANLRVIPSPFTLRPALSLVSINSSSIAFTFSSENATAIQKVDIFVTNLSVAESNTVGVIMKDQISFLESSSASAAKKSRGVIL